MLPQDCGQSARSDRVDFLYDRPPVKESRPKPTYRERGNKRALSAWMYLYLEPSVEVSAVGPMAKAAIGTLLVELLIIFWLRRRFGRRREEAGAAQPVPQES